MNKAIEILEAEIKQLQEAVDKLRVGESWSCEIRHSVKPENVIDVSQVKQVQVKGVKYEGVTYLTSSDFKSAHLEGNILVINV